MPAIAVVPLLVGSLDTLAQLGQNGPECPKKRTQSARSSLLKRARSKHLSYPLATALAELRSTKCQSYRNTIYCAGTLREDAGVITGRYCGNRWCLVCNRIRTARTWAAYLPVLAQWPGGRTGRRFVTLTVPNCTEEALPATLRAMQRAVAAIKRAMRRTDQVPLVALRKIECSYNERRYDYHPHYHFVVRDRRAAHVLVQRWLARWPDATRRAQDIRPADDQSLAELFKYFTKLTVGRGAKGRRVTPVVALDVIFRAMSGLRVYQPVGFRKAPGDISGDEQLQLDAVVKFREQRPERVWEWDQSRADWVDGDSGLTHYRPTPKIGQLVAAAAGERWHWSAAIRDYINSASGEMWYESRRANGIETPSPGVQTTRFNLRPKPRTGVALHWEYQRQIMQRYGLGIYAPMSPLLQVGRAAWAARLTTGREDITIIETQSEFPFLSGG